MTTLTIPARDRYALEKISALVRLGRPKFLLGGFALYALGALAARVEGWEVHLAQYLWGQLAVTSIQLMTHYSNDYFDYEADLANRTPTHWSGGSRVLVRGELPRSAALWAALAMAALSLCAMLVLWLRVPHPLLTISILLVMLVLAWSYSSPPLRLHTRGLGEPTVAIIVPLLTPLTGFVVQSGEVERLPLLLGVPLALLQLVMLLTLELPDRRGDRAAGKRSWAVIFGARVCAYLCNALIIAAFALTFLNPLPGVPAIVARGWVWLLPLAVFQLGRMLLGHWRQRARWDSLAFGSVALFFLATVVDMVALWKTVAS